jgi:hypothetical protein
MRQKKRRKDMDTYGITIILKYDRGTGAESYEEAVEHLKNSLQEKLEEGRLSLSDFEVTIG